MIYRRVIFLDTMAALVVLVAETVRKRCARRGGGVAREDAIEGGGEEKRKGGFKLRSWHYTRRATWKRMSAFLAAVGPYHASPCTTSFSLSLSLRFESGGGRVSVTAKGGVCSLISQPVNNKNIDITRPYIKAGRVFGSFYV